MPERTIQQICHSNKTKIWFWSKATWKNGHHTQKYALILMKNSKQLEVNSCQTCQYWIYCSRRTTWITRSSQFVLFHTEWFNRCAERALERYIRNIFWLIIFFFRSKFILNARMSNEWLYAYFLYVSFFILFSLRWSFHNNSLKKLGVSVV